MPCRWRCCAGRCGRCSSWPVLEERRLREAGAGEAWEEAAEAIDDWLEREGVLARLTDPGAANRWKAAGDDGG